MLSFQSSETVASLAAADKPDGRPLWISIWGGANTLAQALSDARRDRAPEDLRNLVAKLKVYTISDQDDAGRWPEWFGRFGGKRPARFVARFDDAETLHRAAASGLGVALGRLTLAKPLVDAGLLVLLSRQRMKANYAHYLVHPPRSADHAGFLAFRDWLRGQAADYAAHLAQEND